MTQKVSDRRSKLPKVKAYDTLFSSSFEGWFHGFITHQEKAQALVETETGSMVLISIPCIQFLDVTDDESTNR